MPQYQAPKPQYTYWQWFAFIAARVLFPPLLLWDLLKAAVNLFVGRMMGGIVLPAQDMWRGTPILVNISEEKYHVVTFDGAVLDTHEIKHSSQNTLDPKHQTYIINFLGNSACYEHNISTMRHESRELQTNIVGFNFRGVQHSSGRAMSKDDLVIDGIAQVQRLLDKGVSPQNITLNGTSLGAAVATLVARHFHQLDQRVNVFNNRSFSSLTDVVVGHIRNDGGASGHAETTRGKLLGWIAYPLIKLILVLSKWEIDVTEAFQSIPKAYKEYIVVRTRKAMRNEQVLDDEIITHYGSIHQALKTERQSQKMACVTSDQKQTFQARKMEVVNRPNTGGHNATMTSLKNRFDMDANTFFKNFVSNAHKDHGVKQDSCWVDVEDNRPEFP